MSTENHEWGGQGGVQVTPFTAGGLGGAAPRRAPAQAAGEAAGAAARADEGERGARSKGKDKAKGKAKAKGATEGAHPTRGKKGHKAKRAGAAPLLEPGAAHNDDLGAEVVLMRPNSYSVHAYPYKTNKVGMKV
jgi:hypothetical protein